MKFPITLLIPLLLAVLTFATTALVYTQANRMERLTIREDVVATLKLDMTRLQNVLYNLLTEKTDNIEEARLNLSVTAMDTSIKYLMVTDSNDIVILANRYLWEGNIANSISTYNNEVSNQVRKKNIPIVQFDKQDDTLLQGYFPVVLKLENEKGLPIKRLGILFAEVSIDNKLGHAENQVLKLSYTLGALMLLATVVVAVMLHLLISRRLVKLANAADRLASGQLDKPVGLGGKDELAQLGHSFDEMASRIKAEFSRREFAEKGLRELNENLETRITERTVELEEKKQELINSQALAYQANKMAALGEMAGGIAHEINSPLQAITLLTYRLKKEAEGLNNIKCTEIIKSIDAAIYKVSNIIESLRKVSRNSSHDPFEEVSVSDIINDVLGITQERYRLAGVRVTVNYVNDCQENKLRCQRLQIGQVLINLLNNAYDSVLEVDDKWIDIRIETEDATVRMSVTDSGKGIPVEFRDRIFEPMYTTKDIGKGTGLGLSISSEIMMNHHGTLKLDENCSHTRFVLSFPVSQEVEGNLWTEN